MISRQEVERLKRCYLRNLRKSGVLLKILRDLAGATAEARAAGMGSVADGPTQGDETRRAVDPDLSVAREVVVKEIKRLRRQSAAERAPNDQPAG